MVKSDNNSKKGNKERTVPRSKSKVSFLLIYKIFFAKKERRAHFSFFLSGSLNWLLLKCERKEATSCLLRKSGSCDRGSLFLDRVSKRKK